MKPIVLYFSRTGKTKFLAEAIANSTNTTAFDIASSDPAIVENFDTLILGTPVEGFRSAKETLSFVERLPNVQGKKTILFCTYALAKGSTIKVLEQKLSSKGYNIVLSVSKRGVKQKKTDFAEILDDIKKVL